MVQGPHRRPTDQAVPAAGHDYRKVYAAFKAATRARPGQPTVIPGAHHQGLDAEELRGPQTPPHQMKKLTKGRPQGVPGPGLHLEISDGPPLEGELAAVLPPRVRTSDEVQYLQDRPSARSVVYVPAAGWPNPSRSRLGPAMRCTPS